MSEVPEGAILSEDEQWWWDDTKQDWQAVPADFANRFDKETGGHGGGGGKAGFDFGDDGLRISAEDSPVESAGEPLKAAFTVWNTGDVAGTCHVSFKVDDSDIEVTWESHQIEPGGSATPDGDGYVHGIPAQTEGEHEFEAIAWPTGQHGGRATNKVDVGAAE